MQGSDNWYQAHSGGNPNPRNEPRVQGRLDVLVGPVPALPVNGGYAVTGFTLNITGGDPETFDAGQLDRAVRRMMLAGIERCTITAASASSWGYAALSSTWTPAAATGAGPWGGGWSAWA